MMQYHPGHPEDSRRREFDENKRRKAIEFVLHSEGDRLTVDPDDPGGPTKYGLNQKYDGINPDTLTRREAVEIYRDTYWMRIKGPSIAPAVSLALMDFAVHSGVYKAVWEVQRLIGVTKDGIVGPETLNGLTQYLGMTMKAFANEFEGADVDLAVGLTQERMKWITRIVRSQPKKRLRFLEGWMARLFNLQRELLEYYS